MSRLKDIVDRIDVSKFPKLSMGSIICYLQECHIAHFPEDLRERYLTGDKAVEVVKLAQEIHDDINGP